MEEEANMPTTRPVLGVRRSVHSITFKATSNKVTPVENPWNKPTSVEKAIMRNKAFRTAFQLENESRRTSREAQKKVPSIIQSSSELTENPNHNGQQVYDAPSGFVSTVIDAYNMHYRLIIRPDDVWQAILTQFSFYVNAHAEELRDSFVDFQGKKTLVIKMVASNLFDADFARFANRMVDEQITTNIKDPEVAQWLLPSFSTTNVNDRVAASVTIMSTLQAYFRYVCCIKCGIPEVTLEGTAEDWKELRLKLNRLPLYDLEGATPELMTKWHALLAPVLDEFIASVQGNPKLDFWDKVCTFSGGGSGPSYLSGWITVFACFTDKGEWRGDVPDQPPGWDGGRGWIKKMGDSPTAPKRPKIFWPFLDQSEIPKGSVTVPVLVDDNGTQYDTQMLAGQFVYERSEEPAVIRSRTDWCIAYEGEVKANPRNYKDGVICLN